MNATHKKTTVIMTNDRETVTFATNANGLVTVTRTTNGRRDDFRQVAMARQLAIAEYRKLVTAGWYRW